MKYEASTAYGVLPVAVTSKQIRSVRLKVFPSGEIRLSVPLETPDDFIIKLLADKKTWIDKQLELFKRTGPLEREDTIRPGTSTRILGRQLFIKVILAQQKRIVRDDRWLLIYTTNPDDQADIDRQFGNWWQKNAKQYFLTQLDRLFGVVEKHGIKRPELIVKRMQTLWGSCSRKNSIITLNYYLYKAPVPCIEYVILHELIHFIYPRHDRNFHNFMTVCMPDWQDRKHLLDYEIVLGV